MSKLVVSTLLVAVAVTLSVTPKTLRSQDFWQQPPRSNSKLSIEFGAKVFDRPGVDDQSAVAFDTVTGANLLTAERATDFGSTFGAEIKANFTNRWGRDLEFRTVLAEWDEEVGAASANLGSTLFPPSPVTPSSLDLSLASDFYSFELMRRRDIRPGLTILGGPRFISSGDELAAVATVDDGLIDLTATNEFEARNSFFGLQAAIEVNQPIAQSIFVTGFIRAGGYYNSTQISTASFTSVDPTPMPTRTRRQESEESFIGEVGGRVNFSIIPDSLTSFVGYEATWIDGIALTAANITDTGGIDTSNTIFFQAVTFGLNFRY